MTILAFFMGAIAGSWLTASFAQAADIADDRKEDK